MVGVPKIISPSKNKDSKSIHNQVVTKILIQLTSEAIYHSSSKNWAHAMTDQDVKTVI